MRLIAFASVVFASVFLSSVAMAADTVTLPNCQLSLDEEAQVPAQEPGVLIKIFVREGQAVAEGELLAQIDDIVPQMQCNIAKYKLEVAKKQANDIDVQYATAAYEVAKKELEKSLKANQKTPGTVPEIEIDRQRLEREKFRLAIEKAQKDFEVAVFQTHVSEAELEANEANLKRRKIVAPLDAEVIELSRRTGEWVQGGDPVLRLVRIDLLRVEGYLNAKDYQLSELQGRPVNVVVELARGQREPFPGKIVFVSPVISAGGEFLVRAEVKNRKQDGFWVLRPGLGASMTIQLK